MNGGNAQNGAAVMLEKPWNKGKKRASEGSLTLLLRGVEAPCVLEFNLRRHASLSRQHPVFQMQYAAGLLGQVRIVSNDD